MPTKPYSFRYPFDVQTAMAAWRDAVSKGTGLIKNDSDYWNVIRYLLDRDRALEDYLSLGIGQGYLGVAQRTTSQAITGAETDITGLAVTVTLPAHRQLKITVHGRLTNNGGAPALGILYIDEAGTNLGLRVTQLLAAGGGEQDLDYSIFITPTEGTHTYQVQASMSSGSGTFTAFAAVAGYIAVEDIGPV